MSRLKDRVLAGGVRPWEFSDWPKRESSDADGEVPPWAEFPKALSSLNPQQLVGAEVIVADDALVYLNHFGDEISSFDIINQVVPPFEKTFIEFTAIGTYRERHGLHSWGVLLESVDFLDGGDLLDGARWGITCRIVLEPRKGDACGPVAISRMFARPDGTLDRFSPEGKAIGSNDWVECKPEWFERDKEDLFTQEMESALWELLVPALFTISLLHSRNVVAEPVDPDRKLDRKHVHRTGNHLTRYKVLKLELLKTLLDREGEANSKGLAHALHICRGHFKRFTDESPLFGKYTGQWWWAAHKRGDAELGEVFKDYEVRLPNFGAPYRPANEYPTLSTAPEAKVRDPDVAGRGLRAHNVTQNLFAAALEEAGLVPRSPNASEEEFDIGWEVGELTWIGEVKSLSEANEEKQLRAALSQLLRYRQSLEALGRIVRTVVIAECQPWDESWYDLLTEQGIGLTFPEEFASFIGMLRSE
ncbi:MAG: hypothetical protein WA860_14110 [Acidimicrobiales bacterium]